MARGRSGNPNLRTFTRQGTLGGPWNRLEVRGHSKTSRPSRRSHLRPEYRWKLKAGCLPVRHEIRGKLNGGAVPVDRSLPIDDGSRTRGTFRETYLAGTPNTPVIAAWPGTPTSFQFLSEAGVAPPRPRAMPRSARSATSFGKQMRASLRKRMKADNDIRRIRGAALDGETNGRA